MKSDVLFFDMLLPTDCAEWRMILPTANGNTTNGDKLTQDCFFQREADYLEAIDIFFNKPPFKTLV